MNNYRQNLKNELFRIASNKHKKEEFEALVKKNRIENCPEKLYRYRTCNAYSLDSFAKDEIYMSLSSNFNDPYDSLIKYTNRLDILRIMRLFKVSDAYGQLLKDLKDMEYKIAESLQKRLFVSCYTESHESMLMWSHYAENHEGFVLGYPQKALIATQIPIYPVLYSPQRYDATNVVLYYKIRSILPKIKANIEILDRFFKPCINEELLTSIVKAPEWSYENEWRQIEINPDLENEKPEKFIKNSCPDSIYYGAKINESHREALHNIAEKKGIKEYQMYIEPSSDYYGLNCKPFKK